jgi:putative hydrolase of the HAD superfamily
MPAKHPPATNHIETWAFDLDNTLYPADCALFHQVDRRMGEYIGSLFGLEYEAARKLQKDYYRTYGTTLRGLMVNHDIDPHAYLDFVHDIDLTVMGPDTALNAALTRLPGTKVIFTNASRRHAEAVTERLGIQHHFDGIFDIHDADYIPKPAPEIYDQFIKAHGITPERTILFEDTAANLAPAAARGMTTVLVRPGEAGVENDADADYIHYVTDNLAGWLHSLILSP